jgi:L-amino acid N-acyltransferase YncA
MRSELIDGVTVRPLRNGDTETVQAVFASLGSRSRLSRFGGTKSALSHGDLEQLARVDALHHVLVALHDCRPIGIARLVRDGDSAEVAVEVADEWQGRRVGTLLMARLADDARAAGIGRLHAFVAYDNVVSRRLMRRAAVRVSTA